MVGTVCKFNPFWSDIQHFSPMTAGPLGGDAHADNYGIFKKIWNKNSTTNNFQMIFQMDLKCESLDFLSSEFLHDFL